MNNTLKVKALVALVFVFSSSALADAWSMYSYNVYNSIPQIAALLKQYGIDRQGLNKLASL